jgi:hypothetical protein
LSSGIYFFDGITGSTRYFVGLGMPHYNADYILYILSKKGGGAFQEKYVVATIDVVGSSV